MQYPVERSVAEQPRCGGHHVVVDEARPAGTASALPVDRSSTTTTRALLEKNLRADAADVTGTAGDQKFHQILKLAQPARRC
jgi:hypothetical protein